MVGAAVHLVCGGSREGTDLLVEKRDYGADKQKYGQSALKTVVLKQFRFPSLMKFLHLLCGCASPGDPRNVQVLRGLQHAHFPYTRMAASIAHEVPRERDVTVRLRLSKHTKPGSARGPERRRSWFFEAFTKIALSK